MGLDSTAPVAYRLFLLGNAESGGVWEARLRRIAELELPQGRGRRARLLPWRCPYLGSIRRSDVRAMAQEIPGALWNPQIWLVEWLIIR